MPANTASATRYNPTPLVIPWNSAPAALGLRRPRIELVLFRLRKVDCRRPSILLLLDLETEPLALVQAPQAGLLDRADMDEDILASGLRGNEAIALGRIEPLHRAMCHRQAPFCLRRGDDI